MEKTRILIVDDDRDFIADLERSLKGRSHEVHTATNRIEAEDRARTSNPDMVILGTLSPRGDAFEFHKWLRGASQFKSTQLIVVDAPPEKHLLKGWRRDEGMRLEAEDYLARPVAMRSLVSRIDKALDKTIQKIKVLIADDHAVVRDGICAVLALQNDIQVIGEAVDGKDAVDKTLELLPDIVLMDIVMPRMNGLEATKRIRHEYEKAKVLILSQYDDQENMSAGKEAGAVGFIPKRSASAELVAGIRSAWAGREFLAS